jgi:hypothetical protein
MRESTPDQMRKVLRISRDDAAQTIELMARAFGIRDALVTVNSVGAGHPIRDPSKPGSGPPGRDALPTEALNYAEKSRATADM